MTVPNDLANVAAGLRRRTRSLDLVTVAGSIRRLVSSLGSTAEVARRADVSAGMLRKFLSIERLEPEVRDLFKERQLDRVMDAFLLSKVTQPRNQRSLARLVTSKHLTTHELRDAVRFIHHRVSPEDAVKLVLKGRPKTENLFVVAMPFGGRPDRGELHRISQELHRTFPGSSVRIDAGVAVVALDEVSYRRAQKLAKERGLELTGFASEILRRGGADATTAG